MNNRNTIQREYVLNAVFYLHSHVTADEVYAEVKRNYPKIGKGTVYRNLKVLSSEGRIRKIDVADGPTRYDFDMSNHFHVRCVKCDKIFDIKKEDLEKFDVSTINKKGIKIIDFDILFKGICEDCEKKEKMNG